MPFKTRLVLGDWNSICDRCGFKLKASELQREWNGLMVCERCFEPRHPLDFVEGIPDDQSVAWTRPEQDDYFGVDATRDGANFTFRELRISTPDSNVVATTSNVANALDGTNGNIVANTITYSQPF